MSANRSVLITKLQKVLKHHFKAVLPPSNRSVIEHVLFSCCLENSPPSAADDAFARLQEGYFDWNEVRVTTALELSEVMVGVTDALEAAKRLKQALQSIFEIYYSYDLEALCKQNLGKSIADLDKIRGLTPFAKSYITQHAFGGHSIPYNSGAMAAFLVMGLVDESEASKGVVPGLERAIPKAKGTEFGSWVHQFGVEYGSNPFGTKIRSLILEIAPDAKDRFPKRSASKESTSTSADTAGSRGKELKSVKSEAPVKKSHTSDATAKKSPAEKPKAKAKDDKSKPVGKAKSDGKGKSEGKLNAPKVSKGLARKKPR